MALALPALTIALSEKRIRVDNPYQPPDSITWEPQRSETKALGALDAESLEHIRQGQMFVNGAILLVSLAMTLVMLLLMYHHRPEFFGNGSHTQVWLGGSLIPAICFGLAFALAGMARISLGLQDSVFMTLSLFPLLLIPLLNLLMLIAWSSKATIILKANGLQMGFMGAKKLPEPQSLESSIIDAS